MSKHDIFRGLKLGLASVSHKPPINLCRLTAQDSVPIYAVHEKDNLIETYPGLYTRMYQIQENNYQTETEESQQQIFIKLRSVFNSVGADCECAITIFNRDINIEDFKDIALDDDLYNECFELFIRLIQNSGNRW